MSTYKTNRGFTLIELLVVIAIIGILASVVLTSLSSARGKANDAKVQGQLSSMRAQAELFYSTNSNYGTGVTATTCSGAGTGSLFTTVAGSNGLAGLLVLPTGYSAQCYTNPTTGNATAWAVVASNNATFASGTAFWCADSNGDSKSYTAAPTITAATCQ